MKRGSRFNFRRVYPYRCKGCGKKRGTKIYARRIAGFCTVCRRYKVDENQIPLIAVKDSEAAKVKAGVGKEVMTVAEEPEKEEGEGEAEEDKGGEEEPAE